MSSVRSDDVTVNLIWAAGQDGAIGVNNSLPWHLPEDLKHFKELTDGEVVMMGRKTWDSLPERFRPLPNRTNVVLTSRPETFTEVPGVFACNDLEIALNLFSSGSVWVIGGASIYAQLMGVADKIFVTRIDIEISEADAFAPVIDSSDFELINSSGWLIAKSGLRYMFDEYSRVLP